MNSIMDEGTAKRQRSYLRSTNQQDTNVSKKHLSFNKNKDPKRKAQN